MQNMLCFDSRDDRYVEYREKHSRETCKKRIPLRGTKRPERDIDVFIDGEKYGEITQDGNKYLVRSRGRKLGSSYVFDKVWSTLLLDEYGRTGGCYANSVFAAKRAIAKWYEEGKQKAPEQKATPVKALPVNPDAEFFPTPLSLIGKMIAMIDWKPVQEILEPSAGKGDILDGIIRCAESWKSKLYDRYGNRAEMLKQHTDAIEQDENLRAMLEGKEYRVVGDDFLSFFTRKSYDLIIMNPPFSNGDQHLLKALELQERGGQICCILNAETIRNPYTQRRQVLLQKLQELNARIVYIKGAFKKAERPSDVEIAIVYVNIPRKVSTSKLMEDLKKAREYRKTMREPTELVKASDWIFQLVESFEFEAEAGVKLMEEYASFAPYLMSGTEEYAEPIIQLSVNGHTQKKITSEVINDFMKRLRKKYWRLFLYNPRLESTVGKLTSDMRNEYDGKIDDMAEYDFNEYNIRKVLLDMMSQLNAGLHAALMGLFDTLSAKHSWFSDGCKNIHYYNGWKSNKAHKVNFPKVIIPMNGAFADKWRRELLDSYKVYGELDDLEKVMDFLDRGQTAWHCNLNMEINTANATGKPVVDTTYFTATFYKKGTCHIKFKENARHIIDRLNIYAAQNRNWLPPYYGKVKYEDMDDEGKSVIDEFQGAEEYAKVVANPQAYLTSLDKPMLPLLGKGA